MPVFNNMLAGASGGAGAGGYAIERSLRFNSADTAHLSKDFSSTGNLKTWTWSGWLKLSKLGGNYFLGSYLGTSTRYFLINFNSDDRLVVYGGDYSTGSSTTLNINLVTTARFRDTSAWYHMVFVYDTTQSTESDRFKIYVNGQLLTDFEGTPTYPGPNSETYINSTVTQFLGSYNTVTTFDGYLADIHLVDGQALAPADFGGLDDNGVWQPKKFEGSHNYTPTVTYPAVYTSSTGVYGTVAGVNSSSSVFSSAGSTGSGSIKVEFSPAISNITHIKFLGGGYSSNASFNIKVNGSVTHSGLTTNSSYGVRTETISSTNITSFEIVSASDGWALGDLQFSTDGNTFTSPSGTPAVIETAGVNGFHLDFADNSSNAALGTDTSGNSNTWDVNTLSIGTPNARPYASQLVSSTGFNASYPAIKAFDDSTSTYAQASTSGGTLTFTPSAGIAYSSSIKIFMPSAGATASINGGSSVSVANSSEATIATGSGTLTSLVLAASNLPGLAYIKIDDQILVNSGLDSGNDSLVDSPTNGDTASDTGAGGEITGNYATWNPIDKGSAITLTNGNLDIAQSGGGFCKATIAVSSGKWFWEILKTDAVDSIVGIALASTAADANYLGSVTGTAGFTTGTGSPLATSPFSQGGSGTIGAMSNGSIIGFALDCDNGSLKLYLNGSLLTANHFTFSPGLLITPALGTNVAAGAYPTNFGQRAFAYAAPSGYKSLNTASLPTPTIADGSQYFDTKVYTGNGGTKIIPDFNFLSDLVWIKNRGVTTDHVLYDSVRGFDNTLWPNLPDTQHNWGSDAVTPSSTNLTVNRFDERHNKLDDTYVAWAWDAGDSNTTIAAGGLNSSLYNQSQTWSTYGTFTGATSGSGTASHYDWAGVFSASMQTDDVGSMYLASGTGKWTLTSSIACNSGVKFYVNGNTSITINEGLSDEVTQSSTSSSALHYFTIPFSGNIASIKVNTHSIYLMRIYVDGAALIDAGITLGGTDVPNVPTIASTVRANPSAGFSIVKYTGNHTNGATISHGLNDKPGLIIVKGLSYSYTWNVYHPDVSPNVLSLNTTNPGLQSQEQFNETEPTSSVFTVGVDPGGTNRTSDHIAYCFAPVEGYSAFKSHTVGSGTNFVYLGFRPRLVMLKRTGAGSSTNISYGSWTMFDTERDTYNEVDFDTILYANRSYAQGKRGDTAGSTGGSYLNIDILSNGIRFQSGAAEFSQPTDKIIIMAWAEHPFKTARAR